MRRQPACRWPFPTAPLTILIALAFLVAAPFGGPVVLLGTPPAMAQGSAQRVVTIQDAETEAFLRRLSHPLLRAAGIDPALVRITLIQNRAINAFVTPGNRMFIHTGLIQQAQSAGELAGVIAHETGHIAGGHLARLPEEMRNAMLRGLGMMLLGGMAAAASGDSQALAAGMVGGQAAAMGQLYAFTRSQEQAADQAGMSYLDRLGWSPQGLERLLERMLDQELLSVARQDPYFRTHPLSRDRLEFVREQLRRSRHVGATLPPGVDEAFLMVRAKLDGFIDSPATTWRRYPERDTSAPARYARAIAQFRSGRIAEAAAMVDELIRETPSIPWLHELKGQILFEGHRVADSLAPLTAAVRLAPEEPLIRLALARTLIEMGQPEQLRQAVAELEAALRAERESPFMWRQLAVARGRLGDAPAADLALAEEALLIGDAATARMLAQRAEAALPRGPARLRAQDIANAAAPENRPRRGR